jgi:drug/metabolite transporter (DMT)-like permease
VSDLRHYYRRVVLKKSQDGAIAASLFLAVILFGANNTGVKFMVAFWPPIALGSSRFFLAGLVLLAILRWTRLFGTSQALSPELKRRLWWRTGSSLALYIVAFNWSLRLTAVSHVALYMGAAPVWALVWEGPPRRSWKSVQRYGAAMLAFAGVLTLLWPILWHARAGWSGEILGLAASVLWTNFGRQCRAIGRDLSGAELTGQTFWRAAVLLSPWVLVELASTRLVWRWDLAFIQLFSILGGGVVAFALWSNALRHWKTSQVYLFNNLVPISTMAWAHFCLNEPMTETFWLAMSLIAAGVFLGQTNWQKLFGPCWVPAE